jgi:hypothetical protein
MLKITSHAAQENKSVIFVTSRVHPGESPSSIVLRGMVDFLLGSQAIARHLVDHFVFYIVPMMCIDGVVEGFYRCSLRGDDLNRVWPAPNPVDHPVVYHIKSLMRDVARVQKIEAYIDFHGHSCQHGTFAFGCPNDDCPELLHTEKVFPRMLSIISDIFSWPKCVFSYPDERKSASRIVVRKEMDVVNAFTIETSFGGVAGGPLAGTLHDERLWKDFGGKVAEGLYHLVGKDVSPLRLVVQGDLFREADNTRTDSQTTKWSIATRDYTQNRTRAGVVVRKQTLLVRNAVLPRVVKVKVPTSP